MLKSLNRHQFDVLFFPVSVFLLLFIFCPIIPIFAEQNEKISFSGEFKKENISRHLEKLKDEQKVAFLNANFYSIYTNDYKVAIEFINIALELAKNNHWKKQEAAALQNLGVVHYLGGDYVNALPAYLKASDIFDSLQDFEGIGGINNEMSVFYRKQKDYEKSFACLDRSEKAARAVNNLEILGTSLHHRATIFLIQEDFKKAEPLILEVYKLRVQSKDSVGLGYILINLAEIAAKNHQLKKSLDYINQALIIREKISDKQGVAICYVAMGETNVTFGMYKDAIVNFEKSLKKSLSIGFTDLSRYTYQMLATCYEKESLYQKAYINQKEFQRFNDSIFNIEKAKNLDELQTKYETEKKEHQIKIQDLTIAEQEAELKKNRIQVASSVGGIIVLIVILGLLYNAKQLKEKVLVLEAVHKLQRERERISSDLHDHVGAQLTSIISGLQMTETVGGSNQSPQFKQLVESLKDDAQITITHLRDTIWTLKEEEVTPEEFTDHIQKFAEAAFRYREQPVFHISNNASEGIKLDSGLALNFTRVAEEAIHNAIKHSKAENLWISISSKNTIFKIEIKDDGQGFDLTNDNGNEHYGLQNMKRRVNEVKGHIEIKSVQGQGTEIVLEVTV